MSNSIKVEFQEENDDNLLGRSKKLADMTDDAANAFRTAINAIKDAMIFTLVGIVGFFLHGIELRETLEGMDKEKNTSWTDYLINRWKAFVSILGIGFAIILATSFNPYFFLGTVFGILSLVCLITIAHQALHYYKIIPANGEEHEENDNNAEYIRNIKYAFNFLLIISAIFFPTFFLGLLPKAFNPYSMLGIGYGFISIFLTVATYKAYQQETDELEIESTNLQQKILNRATLLGLTLLGAGIIFAIAATTPSMLANSYLQFMLIYALLNTVFVSNVYQSFNKWWYAPQSSTAKAKFRKKLKHNSYELIGGLLVFLGILVDLGFLDAVIPGISAVNPFFDIVIIPSILLAEIAIPTILIISGIAFAYWNETQRNKSEDVYKHESSIFTKYSRWLGISLLVIAVIGFAFIAPEVAIKENLFVQDILMPTALGILAISLLSSFYTPQSRTPQGYSKLLTEAPQTDKTSNPLSKLSKKKKNAAGSYTENGRNSRFNFGNGSSAESPYGVISNSGGHTPRH
jgi:hypothetical protein